MTITQVPLTETDPMVPRIFRVETVETETPDTVTLSAVAEDGAGLAFLPGQFTMLYAFGTGEVPISISGDPASPDRLVHTIRSVGAVTAALTGLRPGAALGVRGPFGTAWPLQRGWGGDVVLMAGGIGLAPLRPAVHELLRHRGDFGRAVLLAGVRSPEDLLFAGELPSWSDRGLDVKLAANRLAPGWPGRSGLVTALVPDAGFDAASTLALLCGPEPMMRFSALALLERGVPAGQIFVSLERNMHCALGFCGHCQFGPDFVCRDGPVMAWERVGSLLALAEM